MSDYRDRLLTGEISAGVWGVGYIGCSTMAYFAESGVNAIGMDVDPVRVEELNSGHIPVPGLASWFDFDTTPLIAGGLMRATSNTEDLMTAATPVHFICVPTEKDGQPELEILRTVILQLASAIKREGSVRPLIIIESTLTPGTTDDLVLPTLAENGLIPGRDFLLGIAPRRDWFVAKGQSLRNLDRVIGGVDQESLDATFSVLSIVCERLHRATDHRVSEMVKCVENAYRHMEISLANQLTLAYPDMDVRQLLRLAGTKWNVGTFHPSFGTGGYCIPLSSQYVLDGAPVPQELTLLSSTVETDMSMRTRVADSIIDKGHSSVAVLGLSYRGNLKVSILSPTIGIVVSLMERGAKVKVADPYYTPEEIKRETGAPAFVFPGDLGNFDAIVITADHREFATAEARDAVANLKNRPMILDNYGLWSTWRLRESGFEYHVPGEANWLGGIRSR